MGLSPLSFLFDLAEKPAPSESDAHRRQPRESPSTITVPSPSEESSRQNTFKCSVSRNIVMRCS